MKITKEIKIGKSLNINYKGEIKMLNSLIVIGFVCLVIIGSMGIALKSYRKKVAKERMEYRRQRDLARQIKLQRKIKLRFCMMQADFMKV